MKTDSSILQLHLSKAIFHGIQFRIRIGIVLQQIAGLLMIFLFPYSNRSAHLGRQLKDRNESASY